MSVHALPCIKCGKPLKNVDEGSDNQPWGGTEFVAYGHYGSTIHDPIGEEHHLVLVANICDTCILRAIDAGVVQSRSAEYQETAEAKIALSRHPITEEGRAWVLAQNEKEYGSAWGEDVPVDYDAEMQKAGWKPGEYTPQSD